MRKEWEPLFVAGQVVEYIKESTVGMKGEQAIVLAPTELTVYKTTVRILNKEGAFTNRYEEIHNTRVDKILCAIPLKMKPEDIVETNKVEVDYTSEAIMEKLIKELPNYDLETIMNLSEVELRTLISIHSGFHPKYVKEVDVTQWDSKSEVYMITFTVEQIPYVTCSLQYEEGIFDLEFT